MINTANIIFHVQLRLRMAAYETLLFLQKSYDNFVRVFDSGLVFWQILRVHQDKF